MKPLPIGLQTFADLIHYNYLYIDKTRYIYNLISLPKGAFFLSRPRRFGKSLLLSTLKAIFQGQKELFQHLWIYNQEYTWTTYPIIHLSFSGQLYENADTLRQYLTDILLEIAEEYGVQLDCDNNFAFIFRQLIRQLSERERVVILIDEYDKPILDCVSNLELAKTNREILKAFYTIIKEADPYLRFVFLTGISKFSKISVFSGLNNLNDLSFDDRYACLLGYTQEELEHYFADRLEQLAASLELPDEQILSQIGQWYNGYQFSEESETVYNPFSILLLFEKLRFKSYWFETGTPTFLLDLIKTQEYPIPELEHLEVSELAFSSYEIEDLRVEPLLYQTGYITIQAYDQDTRLYTLGYPNIEVKQAFLEYILDRVSSVRREFALSYITKLIRALKRQDLDIFFEVLQAFFANIPYDIQLKHEKYYQTIFYLVFTLIGVHVEAEVSTNKGRIDAVVITQSSVFLFEFKLYDSAETALEQIKSAEYFQKYLTTEKACVLIGVEFDRNDRNVGRWVSETLKSS